ncbi:MAG: hypothetical protein DDG58_07950 [Ardenticatenia bacterium]|nr:MAG: hypothetical protein DDG58_07950 [Ardenticatenia bacterium]
MGGEERDLGGARCVVVEDIIIVLAPVAVIAVATVVVIVAATMDITVAAGVMRAAAIAAVEGITARVVRQGRASGAATAPVPSASLTWKRIWPTSRQKCRRSKNI